MTGTARFGIDLVTFAHPGFWGVEDSAGIARIAAQDPAGFWTRMLDAVAATGVTGIETTFPPYGYRGAISAFGTAGSFAAELSRRGLSLCSAFLSLEKFGDWTDPAVQDDILAAAGQDADLIAALGGEALICGLPMRATKGAQPQVFADLARMSALADLANRIGAEAAARGLRLGLHTEAHSLLSLERDVDLLMLLTDPHYVGLCPDSAHLLLSGADPSAVAARHAGRLVLTHWKDATGPMPVDIPIDDSIHDRHRPYFRKLGSGAVDWPAWARVHRDAGFPGWCILEIDATPDPVADIQASLDFVTSSLGRFLGLPSSARSPVSR